jgi:predicted ATPase
MIRLVKIKNFKSHKLTELDFSNLTVLCGTNSSGKSSVIQALLLLREAYFNKYNESPFDHLILKSDSVNIGTAKDALYQFNENKEISFQINTDSQVLDFAFIIEDMSKTFIRKSVGRFDTDKMKEEPLFSKNCQFISASRLGPHISYPKNDTFDLSNQISDKEGKAENVVQFLEKKKGNDVMLEMCVPKYDTDLLTQVTAWEREISSGVNVIVKDNGNLGYELKYQFSTNTNLGRTDEFNAFNVGFGLTYALPIIVAILSVPKDKNAILFIENPESHLHPKGQAKLAELITLAAQAGVQIVLETHSDHIFNGIRKAILKKKIKKENVKVHFFELNEESRSIDTEIQFSDNGKILKYKKGLFDQFDYDLDELLGF